MLSPNNLNKNFYMLLIIIISLLSIQKYSRNSLKSIKRSIKKYNLMVKFMIISKLDNSQLPINNKCYLLKEYKISQVETISNFFKQEFVQSHQINPS